MAAEATFRYIPYERDQQSVCFTLSEKDKIQQYIPMARFERFVCDLDEKYENKVACFRRRYRSIFLRLLERKIFSYSNDESEDLVFYAYQVDIGRENYSNRYSIKEISYATYEFLIDQLYYGNIGSNIFLNCTVLFINNEDKLINAHHMGISITKSGSFGEMDLKVYDTSNYDEYERHTMTEALQTLYNNLSNLDIDSPPKPFFIPIKKDGTIYDEYITTDEIIQKYGHLPHKKTEMPEWEIPQYFRLSPPSPPLSEEEHPFGVGDWGMEEDDVFKEEADQKEDIKEQEIEEEDDDLSPMTSEDRKLRDEDVQYMDLIPITSEDRKLREDEDFKKMIDESLFYNYRMVRLRISYEFNEYLKKKNGFDLDSVNVSIQDGEDIFETGMCTAWTLYFIVEIYIEERERKTSYEVYDLLLSMNPRLRAKFIYVWYDILLFRLGVDKDL